MSTLSRKNGWILRRDDAVRCTCQPVNPRHDSGWKCVTPEQIKAFRDATPPADFSSDEIVRRLAWLWLNWSQDPEAKRLSGRTR